MSFRLSAWPSSCVDVLAIHFDILPPEAAWSERAFTWIVKVRELFLGPFEVYNPYHELEYRAAVMVFFAEFDLPNVTPESAFHRKRALSNWLTYVELIPTYFTEFFLEGMPP